MTGEATTGRTVNSPHPLKGWLVYGEERAPRGSGNLTPQLRPAISAQNCPGCVSSPNQLLFTTTFHGAASYTSQIGASHVQYLRYLWRSEPLHAAATTPTPIEWLQRAVASGARDRQQFTERFVGYRGRSPCGIPRPWRNESKAA
jgi:hypothetical protein